MVRVPYVSREDLPPGKRDIYDQIFSKRHSVPLPFSVLMNSPELAGKVAAVGEHLRYGDSTLPASVREIAVLATGQALKCQYVFTHHVPPAKEAGVADDVINAIRDGVPTRRLLPKDGVIVQFARELLGEKKVHDATFGAVEHLLGMRGTVELVATIGYYAMLCYVNNSLEVGLEEGVAPLLPDSATGL